MREKEIIFNKYIQEYKKLDIKEKRKEYVDALKELIVIFDSLASIDNIELEYIKNNEILDLKSENISEDDFLEAIMVYLEISKDIIGQYLIKK